jgi:hypothetical protein
MAILGVFIASCKPGAEFTFENQTGVDVTVFHLGKYLPIGDNGYAEIGQVPAGETVKPVVGLILRRDIAGDIVVLEARDSSGNVIWQRSWPIKEFLKLKESNWYICICP